MTFHNISSTMPTQFNIFDAISRTEAGGPSVLDICSKHPKEYAKLTDSIEWFVTEEKVSSFYDLDDSDKKELAGQLLAALNDQTEWLVECKDADMVNNALAKYMASQLNEDRDYFMTVIQANAVKYYADKLNDLIVGKYKQHQRDADLERMTDAQIDEFLQREF